jgi:hypothetical protein
MNICLALSRFSHIFLFLLRFIFYQFFISFFISLLKILLLIIRGINHIPCTFILNLNKCLIDIDGSHKLFMQNSDIL